METLQRNSERKRALSINILRRRLNTIKSRFYLLEGEDKLIMSLYIESGLSIRQIALLLNTSPSRISRRIKKIAFKLTSSKFISCIKQNNAFSYSEMKIAKDYFFSGLSIKQIAERENKSFYQIHKLINEIHHTIKKMQKEEV